MNKPPGVYIKEISYPFSIYTRTIYDAETEAKTEEIITRCSRQIRECNWKDFQENNVETLKILLESSITYSFEQQSKSYLQRHYNE